MVCVVKNLDVREYASARGVRLWRIADALGMTDASFSRKLRRELSAEDKQQIFLIVDRLERESA